MITNFNPTAILEQFFGGGIFGKAGFTAFSTEMDHLHLQNYFSSKRFGGFYCRCLTSSKVDRSKNSTHQLIESVRQNYFQAMKFDLHL